MSETKTVGSWQKEFFQNKDTFVQFGLSEKGAEDILKKFLYLCSVTPLPEVMETFDNPEALNDVGVYTRARDECRDFMVEFLAPILQNFEIRGSQNIELITPFLGKYPITVISNHLSHLDAPTIFYILYKYGGEHGRRLAESMVFIAGRLAYMPEFTRLGLYMFDTLLVCSQKDINEQLSHGDVMTKINMRSYRTSQNLVKDGKILAVFPEGTRSRSGRLMDFVDTSYHYCTNRIVLPISLEGTERVLPTDKSYMFNPSQGAVSVGRPLVVGNLKEKDEAPIPEEFDRLPFPKRGDKKTFVIDNLALLIGKQMHQHRHGAYRNLYKGDILEPDNNQLIEKSETPTEQIVIIGHSQMGTAIATALANKYVDVYIYLKDDEMVADFNSRARDMLYYPLFKLPPNIEFTSDPAVMEKATIFVQAESPWLIDEMLADYGEALARSKAPIINVAKGLSSSKTGLVLSDLQNKYGISKDRLMVIAGAVIPYQLMERKFSAQEAAAYNEQLLDAVLPIFNTGYLQTKKALNPTDVIGVQLGSALKTMYALGIGLFDGYFTEQLGGNSDNTIFAFSQHSFDEMKRVGVQLGADESTFDGLSGLSDFYLSCFGGFNLDRKYGYEFARGNKDPEPSHGLYSLRVLPQILDVSTEDFPILKAIYSVVVRGQPVEEKILEIQRQMRK